MDSMKSNKITDIVRLQQILKKWKKVANASKNNKASIATASMSHSASNSSTSGSKGIKFLKRTLSFTDVSSSNETVPKGFLAVCVGKELKRFIIPTDYLRHQAFEMLLREAEEEFGFQQEGVLKIPCHVSVFEKVLKVMQGKTEAFLSQDKDKMITCYISDCDATSSSHQAQMCR
ncbi:protein SMALL AUXIN UP-REGULATED RNA 9-like [Prosopis cineraria]|uniref:protein SMALL AUXIN UP-REGULATED RNA 9-like n=1 Tax=Prosopis cineraria TaxID=364024 RepID=UPI0024106C3C|nr:protein SMALL AUXIN UP-REGULATED RNA 9-like [Prosopis cineraria]